MRLHLRFGFTVRLGVSTLLGSLTALYAQSHGTDRPEIPTVVMDYSDLFDNNCAANTNRPLDSALVAHVAEMLPTYRAQWAARGPVLLRAEVEVAGQTFTYHEAHPAIITCGTTQTMSFPLILNARMFRAARELHGSEADEITMFVNGLFHEMSHRYVHDIRDRFPGRMTPLLTKYSTEPQPVLSHLHLFAIEQLVYRRLGIDSELQLVQTVNQKGRNPEVYNRAHEIVAKEGAEPFVQEIRTAPRPHAPTEPRP